MDVKTYSSLMNVSIKVRLHRAKATSLPDDLLENLIVHIIVSKIKQYVRFRVRFHSL